jgi:hypothetical protein
MINLEHHVLLSKLSFTYIDCTPKQIDGTVEGAGISFRARSIQPVRKGKVCSIQTKYLLNVLYAASLGLYVRLNNVASSSTPLATQCH